MKLIDACRDFAEREPNFYMVAGDHPFDCVCVYCVTFLAMTGLEQTEDGPDPEWAQLRDEELVGEYAEMDEDQRARFRRMTARLL